MSEQLRTKRPSASHLLKCGKCGAEEIHPVFVTAFEHDNCEGYRASRAERELIEARKQLAELRSQLECEQMNYREEIKQRQFAEKQLAERAKDTEMLDWLIKQGPPGAARGIGLNEDAWLAAYGEVYSERLGDQVYMRRAIGTAMKGGL